jgi:hypothetical protein
MSDRILATFRVDPDKWQAFKGKAKAEGSNASAVLIQFVTDYLDGNIDSNIDKLDIDHGLDERIDNAIAKLRDELTETIDNRINQQSERFSAQIERLKFTYQPEELIEDEEEQEKSLVSLGSIFEGLGSFSVEVVPTEVKASDPIAVSKEEKKLIEKIKKELKAIGYTFAVWRQTGYGVWLIWNDRSERYKSAKIRLYKDKGSWQLRRLNSEDSWVPVSENNQVAKAIAPLLVELRNLAE